MALAVALAGALAGAMAGAMARAMALAMALAGALAGALALALARAMARAMALAMALAGALAGALALALARAMARATVDKMKVFNFQDIQSWRPCYSPDRYLPTNWEGTALDIIKNDDIPWADRLWVVCREELIDARTLRLFAVFCARQAEHLLTDECSKNAIDVAERFANGLASREELAAAGDAAGVATWYAAGDAARAAARDAAMGAARAAARDAAAQKEQQKKLIEMLGE